jgi:hypothetical protein
MTKMFSNKNYLCAEYVAEQGFKNATRFGGQEA